MTLIERLRNPARIDGGGLDEARAIHTMEESAKAHEGERVLRQALINEVRRQRTLLHEANEVCRSAYEIACREGCFATNWGPFIVRLRAALANQHDALYPKEDVRLRPG
jgi:hypothetical protein